MLTDQHLMTLEHVAPDGSETWFCPSCGRRVLLCWPPSFTQVVLEPGDEEIVHMGHGNGTGMFSAAALEADLLPGTPLEAASPPAAAAHAGEPHAFGMAQTVDSFIDFGDPEVTDGLGPWIRFLDKLSRNAG